MILPEDKLEETIATVRTAFPSFQDWEYNNAIEEGYDGFSVWGVFPKGSDPLTNSLLCYLRHSQRSLGRILNDGSTGLPLVEC